MWRVGKWVNFYPMGMGMGLSMCWGEMGVYLPGLFVCLFAWCFLSFFCFYFFFLEGEGGGGMALGWE